MKNLIFFFLLLFALTAKGQTSIAADSSKETYVEYCDWRYAKLDGKAFFISRVSTIEKMLGKADSTDEYVPDDDDCGHYLEKHHFDLFYKGFQFEKSGDSLVFMYIHFPEAGKHKLCFGSMKFSAWTSYDDFKKNFPLAARSSSLQKMDNGTMARVAYVPMSGTEADDTYWAFYFVDGKLVWLRYWTPC